MKYANRVRVGRGDSGLVIEFGLEGEVVETMVMRYNIGRLLAELLQVALEDRERSDEQENTEA